MVEEVVALRAEFHVPSFLEPELLRERQIPLIHARTSKGISGKVTVRARLRNSESCGIEPRHGARSGHAMKIRIHAGNKVGTASVARSTATRNVDDGNRLDDRA